MQYTLHKLFTAAALCASGLSFAQSNISTFDDLELPAANTTFMTSQAEAGEYDFTSGIVTFYGEKTPWGGYSSFNFSNVIDTITEGYLNDKSAVTGNGFDASDNYGIAYATQNWPDVPTESLQIGVGINGDEEGNVVSGLYVTNSTWAHQYMNGNYTSGDYYRLVVRGFLAGEAVGDSVSFTLAEYSSTDTVLVKSWEWMDLSTIGKVDSLTFQILSSDDYTPYYFAFDNLTVLDNICAVPVELTVAGITDIAATIGWDGSLSELAPGYQIAIDESATLEPTGTVTDVATNTFNATGLDANTTYYAHIRSVCDDVTTSVWDTVSFKTQDVSSIFNPTANTLAISVSPNPATDFVHIQSLVKVNATVYSIDGRAVINAGVTNKIDIAALTPGIYVLKVTSIDGTQAGTIRFVKNN